MPWPSARRVVDQFRHPAEGGFERFQIGDLAADMHIHADDLDAFQRRGFGVSLARMGEGNAEFGFRRAGGDLGMGPGVDIGIDAQA